MKFNEENIKKLREGNATLVADHDKPELMIAVLKEAFPHDNSDYKMVKNYKYYYIDLDMETNWAISNSDTWNEQIPLADFFKSEEIKFEGEKEKLNVFSKPKTSEERDNLIKELQAMEFKKELPSELDLTVADDRLTLDEIILISLLRMRDIYRDGWVSDTISGDYIYTVRYFKGEFSVEVYIHTTKIFSFQNEKTAKLFLNNFRKELEQVKHLIS